MILQLHTQFRVWSCETMQWLCSRQRKDPNVGFCRQTSTHWQIADITKSKTVKLEQVDWKQLGWNSIVLECKSLHKHKNPKHWFINPGTMKQFPEKLLKNFCFHSKSCCTCSYSNHMKSHYAIFVFIKFFSQVLLIRKKDNKDSGILQPRHYGRASGVW